MNQGGQITGLLYVLSFLFVLFNTVQYKYMYVTCTNIIV